MKEKIKRMMFTALLVVITIILSTILSVYATTTILGSEVGYTDNKGIGASNVQAAIDNTYSSALSLDTRVTTLESKSSDYVKVIYFQIPEITITANATYTNTSYSVSDKIPSGYKLIDCRITASGSNAWYAYQERVDTVNNKCIIQIKNTLSQQLSASPTLSITVIKQ